MITLPSGVEVGNGKMFIIAEIGSNWKTLDDCCISIKAAKNAGADAVKFQLYSSTALYGIVPPEHVQGGTMDPTWLPKLKSTADKVGIEFMCSAFSPELIDAVNPYVNIHKVASAELTHVRMLEKLRGIGKPVILSTGASGERDIHNALSVLRGCTDDTYDHERCNKNQVDVVLMYCVAAYPAKHTLLSNIGLMKKTFIADDSIGLPVGLSDHSLDVYMIPMGSVLAGACVLEKHVNFVGVDIYGADCEHSLSETEFKLMVKAIRGEVEPRLGPTPEETGMLLRHNRRLIAIKDIKPGETFRENENFGIYRSLKDDTHALSPFAITHVIGKEAKREIQAGNGIGPGDF